MPAFFARKTPTAAAAKPSLAAAIKERRQLRAAASPPSFDDLVDCIPPPAYGPRRVVVCDQIEPDYAVLHARFLASAKRF
jgi:hypothetical protein